MEGSEIIGGEFEINIDLFKSISNINPSLLYTTYSSGRAAFYNILEQIATKSLKKILIPDYICASIITVTEKLGYELLIYKLNERLEPDMESVKNLYSGSECFLLVNYFGLLDCVSIVRNLKEIDNHFVVIQDNVQAPFAMFKVQEVDYSFTSFRKSFPAPDGAWVYAKEQSLKKSEEWAKFSQYKIAGSILKGLGLHNEVFDRIYLDLMEKGEELMDDNYHTNMSSLSKQIVNYLDWNRIRFIRQRNARQLIEGLKNLEIEPLLDLCDDCVPLFIPITLSNRDKVRQALFNSSVYCPVHWPVLSSKPVFQKGKELAQTELSLIVDQRYNNIDMQEILRIIERNI